MSCQRCGECCSHMVLSFNRDKEWPAEREWLLAHVGVAIEIEEEGEAFVRLELPCRHLVPAEGGRPAACAVHQNKPQVCAEYPDEDTLEYLRKYPWVTPKCGYLKNRE